MLSGESRGAVLCSTAPPSPPPRTRRPGIGGVACLGWEGGQAGQRGPVPRQRPFSLLRSAMRTLKTRKKKTPTLSPLPTHTELTKKPVDGFSAGLVEDSLFEWAITVMGPPDTY